MTIYGFPRMRLARFRQQFQYSIIMLLPILLVIILMAFLKVLSLVTKKTWLVYPLCYSALANYWSRTRITYNAVNSHSLRTDDAPRGINSPDLGWRNYLDPVYPGGGHNAQQTGFICYLFTFDGRIPKGVTRLGKKGTAMRVCWQEIENPVAVFQKEPIQPTHPINLLIFLARLFYEPVSIPPHMLFKTAEVKNDWFIFAGPHRIHIPNQVINRGCKKDG